MLRRARTGLKFFTRSTMMKEGLDFDKFAQNSACSSIQNWFCVLTKLTKMKTGRLELVWSIVLGVFLGECATSVTGTTCEEIPFDVCSALPYSQTGFPNSLGHASRDQIPPHLGGTIQTLITLGCYDNTQLFLCAAAFPQCTADGRLLPPCRALCEGALADSNCGFWFGFYGDLLGGINCEAMPNSSDLNICVGLDTHYPVTTSEQMTNEDVTVHLEATSAAKTTNSSNTLTLVSTSEFVATSLPRQPITTLSSQSEEYNTEEDQSKKPANSTLFTYYFTSEVVGQGSTESKGGHKMTDTIDKAVRTDMNLPGGSDSSAIPTFGVVLSVLSCAGIVVLLISCAFFRKAFGKPFGSSRRRKPRDGAFYTNPAFNDLPPGPTVLNMNGESLRSKQQPYTLDDLPPHPASGSDHPRPSQHAQPNIYQQEPGGFVEQNLFTVPQSPHRDNAIEVHQLKLSSSSNAETANSTDETYKVKSDLIYSNTASSVAMDTNGNPQGSHASEKDKSNGTSTAPPSGESFPMVSTNMDDGDMVIANPIAC